MTKVNNYKLQVDELDFVKQFHKIIPNTTGIILKRKWDMILKDI